MLESCPMNVRIIYRNILEFGTYEKFDQSQF